MVMSRPDALCFRLASINVYRDNGPHLSYNLWLMRLCQAGTLCRRVGKLVAKDFHDLIWDLSGILACQGARHY